MAIFPIIGALALSSGTILERFILKAKKIDIRNYQTFSFLFIILLMLPFILLFWKAEPGAFEFQSIIVLLMIIFFSVVANLLVFYSLKWEKVTNLEPARILEPLFVILIILIFSFFSINEAYERNWNVIIPAIIASAALVFSHMRKHHLYFNKYFKAAILGSFFFALELALSPLVLEYYSPLSFYFVRCLGVFAVSLFLFRKNIKIMKKKTNFKIMLVSLIWIVYRVAVYYGYEHVGVDFTTLILLLSPVLIYLFAKIFLREKFNKKNIYASIIIVLCVIYATFSDKINLIITNLLI